MRKLVTPLAASRAAREAEAQGHDNTNLEENRFQERVGIRTRLGDTRSRDEGVSSERGDQIVKGSTGMRRYNLVVPEELFGKVEDIAEQKQMTVVEVLRRFIRLGLLLVEAENTPGTEFIIREGDTERKLIFV
jgi:hypothetical protein